MRAPGAALPAALSLAALAALLGGLAAQEPGAARSSRRLVSELSAPAIDRGLRDRDSVRPEQTSRAAMFARSGDAQADYARGSLIVKFRAGTTIEARRALLALVGGAETTDLPDADFDIITLTLAADPEAAATRLSAQPDVEYAQARYRVAPRFRPNDPLYAQQWNLPLMDMERAWDINPGATSSIVVAVLDTGAAFRSGVFRFTAGGFVHEGRTLPALGAIDVPFAPAPDLTGPDRFVAPRDFIWGDANPLDLDGHGTHVAGTIGQLTNNGLGAAGVAFNVRLMPVKVVDGAWDEAFGSPFIGTDDTVARGIRYAVDNGGRVINMSIGRTGPPAPAIQDALTYAVSRGAFVSVAAGNDFLDGNPAERPADVAPQIDGVVAVGAIGRERARAAYSSTGSYVELVAPGGDFRDGASGGVLQQTYDFDLVETYLQGPTRYRAPRFDSFAYAFTTGTSMAAPHVAGLAALLMQQGITNPAAVEAAMKRFATDLGPPGRDDEYGYGLVSARATLRGLGLGR